jgi:hypothetical protein
LSALLNIDAIACKSASALKMSRIRLTQDTRKT